MKNISFLIALLLCSGALHAQDSLIFNGNQYFNKNNVWYLKAENNLNYRVDLKVITIKFKERNSTGNILSNIISQYNLKLLRRSDLGYIDIELPDKVAIFEIANELIQNKDIEDVER